jgi:RNA recognition motif-containing protein
MFCSFCGRSLRVEGNPYPQKEKNMSANIYVGSLPYSIKDEQLQELFATYGTVEAARVITDKYTGQSRGFGFVEMGSQDEAQRAIQALNGTQLDGRTLVVNEARPQEKRSGQRPRSGGGDRNRW